MRRAITTITPARGRNVELLLTALAIGVVILAYVNVTVAESGEIPPDLLGHTGILAAIALGVHLVLRWRASYADPIILPIVTLLNGIGLVMIHRLDLAAGRDFSSGLALRQLIWTGIGVAIALVVLVALRDHRVLRRYTYTAGLAALVFHSGLIVAQRSRVLAAAMINALWAALILAVALGAAAAVIQALRLRAGLRTGK